MMEEGEPIYQDLILTEEEKMLLVQKCVDVLLGEREEDEDEEMAVSVNVAQYRRLFSGFIFQMWPVGLGV